ncbi:putative essential nuclear protein 1 [Monocercomonoides exilis]|uniref:putative essential nuclear protein 1 n=1 Tax=Monocercomonoides exilis TaxID=2049356 RepID=UPI00355A76D3|nr:putative essential nuclear protein 1 [Monocercomonoides exilis]|eukprot:MONOS_3633.1-p1 / transcript=MONOS_3633.1 / gene=MONOS_3633 / organism=Monocercomonoides_exilis_PA203 / gene_product=Bystin / transcript_product=Bystin / location=Mono_scaffold00087:48445-50248(-) / protein_length=417 / sequence_SO=supercontig / SO=protein_coding / is_pseudo=false
MSEKFQKKLQRTLEELDEDEDDFSDEEDAHEARGIGKRSRNSRPVTIEIEDDEQGEDGPDDSYDLEDGEDILPEDDDPEQEDAIRAFMNPNPQRQHQGPTIAELLADKLEELKRIESGETKKQPSNQPSKPSIPHRVVRIYDDVGKLLKTYKSGKLPKPFKVIPSLKNWEEFLALTHPDEWSPQAVCVATKLFSSNLNSKMSQRFYNLVLLPRVREDIHEHKKLNYHLYQAMMRSLFRPDAFFKGMLLPLCYSGDCSLVEAVIIGSIIKKRSIPVLYSCAAIEKIAEMDYSGTNSYFLRILLDKKYNLAQRTIQSVYNHFIRFKNEKRLLPVIWHQSLLVFAQRYKNELSEEQINSLIELVTDYQFHYQMGPEIKRELMQSDIMKKKQFEKGAVPSFGSTGESTLLDDSAPWIHTLV